MSNYLIHHGILGQKKGVRNGPPYPLGVSDHSSAERTAAKKAKKGQEGARWFRESVKLGKDKSPISPAEKVVKESSKIVDSAKETTQVLSKYRKINNRDLSKIPDEELRKRVNRLNLERQYSSLTSEDTKDGFEITGDILSVLGGIVGIVGGTLAIVTTVKNLK